MEGDEKTPINNTVKQPTKIQIWVEFDKTAKLNINSMHDRVMLQILEDSAIENDEPLRLIEKRIWDPKTEIVEFDVNDSTVLKLMYGKPLDK